MVLCHMQLKIPFIHIILLLLSVRQSFFWWLSIWGCSLVDNQILEAYLYSINIRQLFWRFMLILLLTFTFVVAENNYIFCNHKVRRSTFINLRETKLFPVCSTCRFLYCNNVKRI